MDHISKNLIDSNDRLIVLENSLDIERLALIDHRANKNVESAGHIDYLCIVERYSALANDYCKELGVFKSELKNSVDEQKKELARATAKFEPEIEPDHLPCFGASPERKPPSSVYSNESVTSAQSMASPTEKNQPKTQIEHKPIMEKEVSVAPSVAPSVAQSVQSYATEKSAKSVSVVKNYSNKPKKNTPTAKVTNAGSRYKYGGKGSDIWKKNGGKSIFTETKLQFLLATFDFNGDVEKLKFYLMKNGGLNKKCIQSVEYVKGRFGKQGDKAFVKVKADMKKVKNAVRKVNKKVGQKVLFAMRPNSFYTKDKADPNNRLFASNFDILREGDHWNMTKLFLQFGDLKSDIYMGCDKNGCPFAIVEFVNVAAAVACMAKDRLSFNGRVLSLHYATERKQSGNRKKKQKFNGRY